MALIENFLANISGSTAHGAESTGVSQWHDGSLRLPGSTADACGPLNCSDVSGSISLVGLIDGQAVHDGM